MPKQKKKATPNLTLNCQPQRQIANGGKDSSTDLRCFVSSLSGHWIPFCSATDRETEGALSANAERRGATTDERGGVSASCPSPSFILFFYSFTSHSAALTSPQVAFPVPPAAPPRPTRTSEPRAADFCCCCYCCYSHYCL